MTDTLFVQSEFWALICFSVVVPALAYAWAARRRRLLWAATCLLGLLMVAVSATDVVLLQELRSAALHSLNKADDAWFSSEIAVALYAFPILYGGVGVNFISTGLVEHFQRVGPGAWGRENIVPVNQPRGERASAGRDRVQMAVSSSERVSPRPRRAVCLGAPARRVPSRLRRRRIA